METQNQTFTVVVTGRCALPFAKDCLGSIQAQSPPCQLKIIYVDDASEYNPLEKEELYEYLNHVDGEALFLDTRHYQIGALSRAIPQIKDKNTIVCLIDGDDYLLPHALSTLTTAYSDPNIVMTYGNVLIDFRPYQDLQSFYFHDKKTVNTPYPLSVWKKRTFREDGFRCFHLRSFKRWLWDYIDPKDFLRPSGDFFHASGDSAFIFPMLELLADPKHVAFIEKPLYIYRLHNGNVHNHDKKSQREDLEYLRFKKTPYLPLNRELLRSFLNH
ncbi:glycosyltransferase family A protein [Candidatus Neptunochlamydia vexilliferae]|uniref:Glycosyltransferase 2-like domain-containing protein n=1 Tax=Candidatus Neptunichlamydia vexilliferae TaxID=1651774 RepID=A0ABS0B0A9_9BACT|nr:glycosyltransferase family A protein [Candidatus Neptunochlamydia vexilliferae]MBF5059640.1 hypothetical protein [Candidatus Neptunochlamydia vexilliferae]